ncbi:tRNA(His) guanylyltransferase-like [Penaeus monodon]|uniref:tRNA(His) guanylyltransferase-like n=1 Tax=Penaeus monodon TaxID=6687 RepID=UPI0018A71E52|nr:tRNA(His) guanylyltransferase-like [Penaeus monodon]
MKEYEDRSSIRLLPLIPTLIRLDGRSFHNFTKGLDRPYDERLRLCMVETMKKLVSETNARCGYTQSDEITLLLHSDDAKSMIWFDGKHSKMVSQSAALATLYFNQEVQKHLPDYLERNPTFDSRCWQVPTKEEAANAFLWREMDATRNSISMAAHAEFSTRELHGKSASEKQDMLIEKGINWNDYPADSKGVSIAKEFLWNRNSRPQNLSNFLRSTRRDKTRFDCEEIASVGTLPSHPVSSRQ